MGKTEMGVLILNEWFEAIRDFNKGEFYKIVVAMYDYQILGKEPPVFEGKSAGIAKVIFAQLERRIAFMQNGKLGAEKRLTGKRSEGLKNTDQASSDPSSEASSEALSEALSEASSEALSQPASPLGVKENKIKEKQIKYIYSSPHKSAEKSARTARGGAHSATAIGARGGAFGSNSDSAPQSSQNDSIWNNFPDYAVKKALGEID